MKAEYINPFAGAAFDVLEMLLGQTPTKGEMSIDTEKLTRHECNVICGVSGSIQGSIVYSMSMDTASDIASAMMGMRIPDPDTDQLGVSAISELCNMISGNAMTHLSALGLICDITPPTVVRGARVEIVTVSCPRLVVPMCTQHGEVDMALCLRGEMSKAA